MLLTGWFWSGLDGLASLGQIKQLNTKTDFKENSFLNESQIHDMIEISELGEIQMNVEQVMDTLLEMGSEQNQKIYKRHGASEPLFGVSFANIKQLKKKIKIDHELALQLWDTENMDAQLLACMVSDPEQLTITQASSWINSTTYYVLAGEIADLAAKSPHSRKLMDKWMKSKKEFVKQGGYSIFSSLLKQDGSQFSKSDCKSILKTIETEIHDSPNRARYSMNSSVIAIGVWHPDCADLATKTAKRIGKVHVDHGDTSCKTPDAASYIEKTLAYQKAKAH